MAKQLNIDLSIRADTKQAEQALNALHKNLQDIQNIKNMPMVNDTSYQKAAAAAKDLERNLTAAVNIDTGKLDLNKFSMSLNKSNTSITELAVKLSGAGATGQQAFLNLAKTIALADNSALNLGTKLGGLMTTLKNTARWQISSSVLHGFMGAISSAYGYAQDLNESLNNIRIITGQNVDEMAKFAVEANNSAKALSTTTTEYTNASLIYYQQGLSNEEVKARTDATIKLANVSRQSAEEVSSQMTAIWNNFADGNTNLEYYEDVITKLGATTASSSSEIAEGLQKFAAVADTVDLSYEKASASLATVVAETRQSADVVGTAFKTLFARLEGLNLGETLEDGTTLNKYSAALQSVGVNIKDQSGELKSMDNILNEIGAKWESLGKDQQVALAQTVAGVRQYTQFVALMDNYDKVLQNEETARGSSGTVDEQAEIYAESWEAARDRVTAASQEIYDQLLNDEAFVGILNGFEKMLEFISNIIDGMGGLKGVLLLIGSIFMNSYAKEMPRIFNNLSQNLMIITGQGQKIKDNMLEEVKIGLMLSKNNMVGTNSQEMQAKYEATQKAVEMTRALNSSMKALSQTEIEEYKAKIAQTTQEGEYLAALGKELDILQEKQQQQSQAAAADTAASYGAAQQSEGFSDDEVSGLSFEEARNEQLERWKQLRIEIRQIEDDEKEGILDTERASQEKLQREEEIKGIKERIKALQAEESNILKFINGEYQQAVSKEKILSQESQNIVTRTKNWENAQKSINQLLKGNTMQQKTGKKLTEELTDQMSEYAQYLKQLQGKGILPNNATQQIEAFDAAVKKAREDGSPESWDAVFNQLNEGGQIFDLLSVNASEASLALEGVQQKGEEMGISFNTPVMKQLTDDMGTAAIKSEQLNAGMQKLRNSSNDMKTQAMTTGEAVGKVGSSIMQVSMAINGLKNIGNIWSNEDLSTGEKLLQTLTSLGMILPVITMFTNKQKLAELSLAAAKILHVAGSSGVTAAEWAEAAAKEGSAVATWTLIWPIGVLMAAVLALIAVIWLIVKAFEAWQESTPEGQLKKAEETARELADAAKEAKERVDNLREAFESYHTITNKLNSCVKGTQEWRDTLIEVNNQVIDLLKTYPQLAKYVKTDSDGVMSITAEGEKELTKSVQQGAAAATAASTAQNQEVRQKRMDVMVKELKGDKTDTPYEKTMMQNYIKKNKENFASMDNNQIKENLQAYADKNHLSVDTDKWVDSIDKLTAAVKEDTAATKAETQATIENALVNNKEVQGSGQKKDITTATSNIYNDIVKNKEKELKDYTTDNSHAGGGGWGKTGISQADSVNDEAKKVWQEYLDAAGLNETDHKLVDTTGDDEHREFVYEDANGDKQTVSLDAMRKTKAAADALAEAGEAAKRMVKDFNTLSKSTENTDKALESFLTNKNFESTSAEATSGLDKYVTKDKDGKYTADSDSIKNYLTEQATALGYDKLDDMAKKYGYENGEKYVEAFAGKAKDITKAWDEIDLEEMGLDKAEGWAKNLSINSAKVLSNNFRKITRGPMGEAAAKEYINGISAALDGLDTDKQQAVLDELVKIDWSAYDAFDQMNAILKKNGKTLDENDPKWTTFIANMRRANSSIPDFTTLNNNLTSISKLLKDLDFGKTVSDEDYEKIVSINKEWEKFFMIQSDGTRQFIGDSKKMQTETQNQVEEARKAMKERKGIQDSLNNDKTVGNTDWNKKADDIQDSAIQKKDKEKDKVSDEDIAILNNAEVRKALTAQGYSNEDVERIVKNYNDNLGETGKKAEDAKVAMANLWKAIGDVSTEEVDTAEQNEKLNEQFASTATSLSQLQNYYNEGKISAEAYDKQLTVLAMSAKSLSELQSLQEDLVIGADGSTLGLTTEEYSEALLKLAENYDNCTNEILEYQKALASGSQELVHDTQVALENAIAIGEMAKALDLEAEKVEEQAKELISVNNLTEEQYEVASKVAVLNQSMNKGVKELVDNWADYKKVLQSSEKGTEDYADAALKTKEALAQLLGVTDKDFIPDDFLEIPGVMDLIDKAIKGDEKAINSLGVTMAEATIKAFEFKEGMKDINGVNLTADSFNNYKNEVLEGITSLTDAIKNGTIQAGEDITSLMDGTGQSWAESLNEMAYITGMSVEEMNSLLNEMGVEADVTTKTKIVKTQVPIYETRQQVISEGNGGKDYTARTSSRIVDYWEADTAMEVAQINMGDKKGTPPTITYAGRDNVSSSALTPSSSKSDSSSDSSSDKKNTSAAAHEHEIHRYSNEENAVNGLTKQYERLNKVKDKAFGASKIFAMEQELKALKDLKKASSDYLDAIVGSGNGSKIAQELAQGGNLGSMIANGRIGGTAGADYRALFNGADASGKQVEYTAKDSDGNEWLSSSGFSLGSFNSMFGTNLSFNLDSYGNIQNKDSILNLIQNLTNSENDAYSRVADPDAGSTTEHNKRLAYLEAVKERIEQYGDTVDTLNDKVDEYLDRITEIQEKNAEIITAKLEQGVNLGQKTIQRLERSLKVLGDNIYKTAEAMSKWYEATFNKGVEADKKQADSAIAAIADAEARVKLYEKNPYDENAISPEQAAEIIDSAEGTLDSVIDSLLQRVEEGKEYFGNTLDYWNEKLDKVNTSIDNNIKILDHFQNILSLLGKSADYGRMNILLEGQSRAAEDNYNSLKRQAQAAEQIYKEAEKGTIGLSGEALQEYKDNVLQKAYEDFQNAVDAMYSGLESWIEIENAKFENKVSQTFAKTEDKLTGEWGGFDALDAAMSRQRSVAEEYLTKTNQLYETNSLMRKLSQDIDKTDSKIAKNKLKAFQDEIEAMQKQEKLSKTDLDIAKARYEVLQAELALEEAKNAKTTVRLQRDNEGNFGYVYTADQDQVTDAEQILEDKQNALYNLGLQKAQEYGEKIISIRKEWQAEIDTVIQEWREGKISSEEELNTILADINARYRELETSYLESYVAGNNVLNEVGAEGQTEAWTNSFNEIITEHRLFNDDSENALNDNSQTIKSIAEETTDNLLEKMSDLNEQRNFFEKEAEVGNSQLRRSVGEVTTSVSNLSKEVTKKGGLADSMVSAAAKAQDLTNKFFSQYDALQNLINQYSKAADGANEFYQKMVDLINVQIAYNHAKNGATSVSWGPGGVHANYSNNFGGGGSDSGGGSNNGGFDDNSGDSDEPKRVVGFSPIDNDYHLVKWSDGTSEKRSHMTSRGSNKCIHCGYVKKYGYKKLRSSGKGTVEIMNLSTGQSFWVNDTQANKAKYGYKTGGYTGSWNGPNVEENGKLAFLHQKELVLNATDTENMLEAVKLIRQISQQIDLQAISQSSGFSAVATQFFSDREPLQQDITIHAEFPNATDHNEIEQAFDNLANKAAQFANRY